MCSNKDPVQPKKIKKAGVGRKTEEQRDRSEPRLPTASLECSSYWPQVNLLVKLRGLPFPPPVGDHLRVEGD